MAGGNLFIKVLNHTIIHTLNEGRTFLIFDAKIHIYTFQAITNPLK